MEPGHGSTIALGGSWLGVMRAQGGGIAGNGEGESGGGDAVGGVRGGWGRLLKEVLIVVSGLKPGERACDRPVLYRSNVVWRGADDVPPTP